MVGYRSLWLLEPTVLWCNDRILPNAQQVGMLLSLVHAFFRSDDPSVPFSGIIVS